MDAPAKTQGRTPLISGFVPMSGRSARKQASRQARAKANIDAASHTAKVIANKRMAQEALEIGLSLGIPPDAKLGDVDFSPLFENFDKEELAELLVDDELREEYDTVIGWAATAKVFGSLMDSCATCGKQPGPGYGFQKCSACKGPRYCSKECQRVAWKQLQHKQSCRAALPLPTPRTVARTNVLEICQILREYGSSAEVRVSCVLRIKSLGSGCAETELIKALVAVVGHDALENGPWQMKCSVTSKWLACEVLVNTCLQSESGSRQFQLAGGVAAAITAGRENLNHRNLVCGALLCLHLVSLETEGEIQARTLGAMELASHAMTTFPINSQIQKACCDLLRNLAGEDATADADFARHGVKLILKAHSKFAGSVCAGAVLKNLLTTQPANRELLTSCLRLGCVRLRRHQNQLIAESCEGFQCKDWRVTSSSSSSVFGQ